MFNKFIYVMTILFLLTACNQGNRDNEETDDSLDIEEGLVESEKETIILPETDEEWLVFSEENKWYEEDDILNVTFNEPIVVDFEGDLIPEVVIPYSPTTDLFNEHHGYLIGKYDSDEAKWSLWQNYELDVGFIPSIKAIGKLKIEDQNEMLITEEMIGGAANVTYRIGMYRLSSDENQVILAATHMAYSEKPIEIDFNQNKLRFVDQGELYEFQPEGDQWLVSDTKKLYLRSTSNFYNEEFWSIVGENAAKVDKIRLDDSYDETIKRVGEPQEEGYWSGAKCAYYSDYYFCKVEPSDEIIEITIRASNDITIQDFEKVIGASDSESEIGYSGYYYSWSYYLGDVELNIEGATQEPDSKISIIHIFRTDDQNNIE